MCYKSLTLCVCVFFLNFHHVNQIIDMVSYSWLDVMQVFFQQYSWLLVKESSVYYK